MLIERIMGVLKLDANTFEEIEHDQNALTQAAIIVAIVALASGIGSSIGASNFIISFLVTIVWAFVGWAIWAGVTYWIGTSLFGGQADMGEMLRVLGFAQAPRVLSILGFITCLGPIASLIGAIWALIAGVIAVRQGLDVDTGKAVITVVIGWIVLFIGSLIIGTVVGGAALGIGALTGGLGG
jgi:hypothetical protein